MRRRILQFAAVPWLAACRDASWDGVDESVVARFAEDAGRKPGPLFETVQGDLLLFAFLWAGLLAGFALGYYWRVLFVERTGAPGLEPAGAPGDKGRPRAD